MVLSLEILLYACANNKRGLFWAVGIFVTLAMLSVWCSGAVTTLGESRKLENYLSDGNLVLIRGRYVERFSKNNGIHLLVELKPGELRYLFYGKGQRKEDYGDNDFVMGHYYRYIGKNLLPLPIGKNA